MYVVLADPWAYTTHHKHATKIMINAEKVYDDYLYDCYIANRQLTDEDWLYYGREEHHVEIPNRDGGLLTPCNSQHLTKYQHWVAGVLQSEVLQKMCFAAIPRGALNGTLENLREKWQSLNSAGENNSRYGVKLPEDQKQKTGETMRSVWEKRTTEQKSSIGKKAAETVRRTRTPQQILEINRKVARVRSPRPIILTTPAGEEIYYELIYDACLVHGLESSKIGALCRKINKQHKGYKARYAD
jgi:hypothetical protein